MQVNITARHLKLTPAIADYVQKKVGKANRHVDGLIWCQVVLDVSKNRHLAEIIVHARGQTFMAKEESTDLYAAIDLSTDKIDKQLRRYKERRRGHRPDHINSVRRASWSDVDESLDALSVGPDHHRVSSVRVLRLIPLSVSEAIAAMEQSDSAHWIFMNRESSRVTVLYRKPDRSYGVVEAVIEAYS